MGTSQNKIVVVFIGSSARSGSTILDRVLGQAEGYLSVGELRLIWEEAFAKNYLCGCGRSVRSCAFWNMVTEEAFGNIDNVDAADLMRLWRSVDRIRNIPQIAFPHIRTAAFQSVYTEYVDVIRRLFKGIHKVSGGKIIVDSSKALSHGLILNAIQEIDLRTIHLIRDSRAVAFSMLRKKDNPAAGGEMGRQGVLASSRDWLLANGSISIMAHQFSRYTLLKYEEFSSKPLATLQKVLNNLDLQAPQFSSVINQRTVKLQPTHMISGNPVRFKQGNIEILPDTAWEQEMTNSQRLTVTLLTWPLLFMYGYLGGK